jgi:release factor glutamine methyltransferase
LTIQDSYLKYQHLPRHQLELLLAYLFNQDRLWVLTHGESQVSDIQQKRLAQYTAELMLDTPLAYIVGYKRFYDVDFMVNKHVLIPRQETEELVQHIVQEHSAKSRDQRSEISDQGRVITMADIGTGSGCIGLTLARLLPDGQFYLIDKSKDALVVATKNYEKQQSPSNVNFFHGDLIQPLMEAKLYPQVLIANLPYISVALYPELPKSVVNYEPRLALDGGSDGLSLYRQLIDQIVIHYHGKLLPELWLEISPEQQPLIAGLFKLFAQSNIKLINDLNDRLRFVHVTFT